MRSRSTGGSEPPRRWRRTRRAAVVLAAVIAVLTVASLTVNVLTGTPASTPSGLTFVRAGDVPTRVRTWGTTGPPVVLVHGAAETADTWDPVARLLSSRYHVYAFDLVGWGYSRRVPPYTLDHQTRQLLGLIEALGLQRPVLAAHSSGAAPAAEAVLRAPERTGGLLLLDGDALATGAGQRSGARYLVQPPFRTTLLRLALRSGSLIRSVYDRQCGPRCPALDDPGVDAWRRPLQVGGAEGALWAMLNTGAPGLTPERLAQVSRTGVATAVVFGAQDDVFPPGTAEQTAQRIGAPAPVIIPQARHLTMISDPCPVATAIALLARRAAGGDPAATSDTRQIPPIC